jgi:hypothetical protein
MRESRLFLLLLAALMVSLGASASAQERSAALDDACLAALDVCSVDCTALDDGLQALTCLNRCDAAATICLGDDKATLSAEEYLAHQGYGLSFKAAACHSLTPCPPEYGACTNWSSFSDCGDPHCGISTLCKECDEWGQCTAAGPAMKQDRERFRVCFDQQMQGCTEYQRTSSTLGCGC